MGRQDQETRGNHWSHQAERGDPESHRDRDGTARIGNTFEAKQRQMQHIRTDEMADTQLLQLEVTKPTTLWIDHVEQGEEDDQENWNIDNFGRTAKGKGKQTKGGDGDARGLEGKCCWCEEPGNRASECHKKTAYVRGKDRNNIHQVEDEDQERHDQPQ